MPKLGSQLLDFIWSGLVDKKYPNLQYYDTGNGDNAFSLEHVHKRSKKWPEEFSRIYEDYYALKRPDRLVPGWTKLKGMLDSALNRKGSKYIHLLGRDGKKFVYVIDSFVSSGSEPSSPTSPVSTSGDEAFEIRDLKPGISMSSTILFPQIHSEINDMALTLSPEMYEIEYTDLSTDCVDNSTLSPETPEVGNIEFGDIENFDGNEVLLSRNNDEMEMFSDEPTGFLKNSSPGSDIQQNVICDLGSMKFLKMENQPINLIPNEDGVVNPNTAPPQNETAVYASQLRERTNGNDTVDAASLQNALASTAVQSPSADVQCVPEFALVPTNLSQHIYCERSLEVAKTGEDEYTYIFKTVSNSLPLNDPVFLYLSKMCCPA